MYIHTSGKPFTLILYHNLKKRNKKKKVNRATAHRHHCLVRLSLAQGKANSKSD